MMELLDQLSKSFYFPLTGLIVTFVLLFYFAAKIFEGPEEEEALAQGLEPDYATVESEIEEEEEDSFPVDELDLNAPVSFAAQAAVKEEAKKQNADINPLKIVQTNKPLPSADTSAHYTVSNLNYVQKNTVNPKDVVILKQMEASIGELENYDQVINKTKDSIRSIDKKINDIKKRLENINSIEIKKREPNVKINEVINNLDDILVELKEGGNEAVTDVLPKLNEITQKLLNSQKKNN